MINVAIQTASYLNTFLVYLASQHFLRSIFYETNQLFCRPEQFYNNIAKLLRFKLLLRKLIYEHLSKLRVKEKVMETVMG